jgi:hypothetical protein
MARGSPGNSPRIPASPGRFTCPPGTRLELILEVKEGEELEVIVEVQQARRREPPSAEPGASWRHSLRNAGRNARLWLAIQRTGLRLEAAATPKILFIFGLALFVVSRFYRLADFPIAFNSDEIVAVMRAVDLVRDGFVGYEGQFLPTFFVNDFKYSLGATVYLQVVPYLLFGKSIWAVRGISVLISLLGMIWLGLMLREIYRLSYWWLGVLVLTATPAWFLLTRTAFETAQMTAFFAGFLYYYLLYRLKDRRYLYPSLVLGALAFYSYLPGQVMVVLTGAAFLAFDWRYHWQDRRTLLRGAGLLVLLALPLIRFELAQPGRYAGAMERYSSYLAADRTLGAKLSTYLGNYLRGLSPRYLFWPHTQDELPFLMKGYGHMGWWNLPFTVAGGIYLLRQRRWREVEARAVFVPLLVAPLAGALLATKIARELMIVLPLVVMTTIGFVLALEWLERRSISRTFLSLASATLFAGITLFMMFDAIRHGPTWFRDYGLGGLQYGANQVFPEALEFSKENPTTRIYLTGGWCWSADAVSQFYLPKQSMISLATPDQLPEVIAGGEDAVFIVIPEEYNRLVEIGDYRTIDVEHVVPYPDGTPGFRFVRLAFTDDKLEAIRRGYDEVKEPVAAPLSLDGEEITLLHTPLGGGGIENLFDGDPDTFVRSDGENPFRLDIAFQQAHRLAGLVLRLGSEKNVVSVTAFPEDGTEPVIQAVEAGPVEEYKEVVLNFDEPIRVERLLIEILDEYAPPDAFVHVWELKLLE